ncbi:MAG TPA: hypothetical protein VHP99_07795, partial [Pyrinomonadaceae bacterium]|nr:hypothetical protein [Pyrinomonadaceae bacterium]
MKQQRTDRIASEAAELSSEFDRWVQEYLAASNAESVSRGVDLAARRRALLKELIRSDPARALRLAVPKETLRKMPVEVQTNLEEQISAHGDFMVLVSDEMDPVRGVFVAARVDRKVVIRGRVYEAAVYGRWLDMACKKDIPIAGIAIDGVMAVDESPLRRLSSIDVMALSTSRTLAEGEIATELGGEVRYFNNEQDLSAFTRALVSREMMIGPDTEEHRKRFSVDAVDGLSADSAWTEGPKKVLFIRIDFPDKPGEPLDLDNQPLTSSDAQSLMDTQISPFYVNSSYNKTSLHTTVTPVVRMPQPQSAYFQDNRGLFRDAETAARAAGFEPDNFNLDLFAMSHNPGFPYAGIAQLGSSGAALNGEFNIRVTAHELGHNYGLKHANRWQTTDGTVIGAGSNVEYGNFFDEMGCFGGAQSHFNVQYKHRLNWLTDSNVQTVTGDGTYRIFAEDSPSPGGIRAIKIRKNSTKNYWIEFRQLFTDNPNAMNGAFINWDYLSRNFTEVQLLDMNPNGGDISDSPLGVGENFFDDENRIRITVIGKRNTTPQSLDVKVELNVGCTYSLVQTSQSISASGGEGTIPINTLSGCVTQASSNDTWLSAFPTD